MLTEPGFQHGCNTSNFSGGREVQPIKRPSPAQKPSQEVTISHIYGSMFSVPTNFPEQTLMTNSIKDQCQDCEATNDN
jgi:hypothetical protein